jgi:outer membrane protein assembly factor BamB
MCLLWHTYARGLLYRGTVGTTTVYAHNIDNGELLWSTWLPSAHSTSTIYFADNKIFVFSNDGEFYVLNE